MGGNQFLFGRNILAEAVLAGAEIQEVYGLNESARRFVQDLDRRLPLRSGFPPGQDKGNHQGVAFRTTHQFYVDYFPDPNPDFVVLCNHIEDVGNFGAIIRSAAAFGVGLIVHENKRSARLTPAAIRASSGMAFRLKFLEVANIERVIQQMKKDHYWIMGLAMEGSEDLYQWEPQLPLGLVLGSEESGITRPVMKAMDSAVRVPMASGVESLNVAQASSVAMSWIYSKASLNS